MAVEFAPATPLGRIQIRRPRTSTVGAKLREARTTVFQECVTPASKPRPNKRGQTRHHDEYSGLERMLVRARKNKGKPTEQEYSDGKRTKERDEETGIHEGVAEKRQQKDDDVLMVGAPSPYMPLGSQQSRRAVQ